MLIYVCYTQVDSIILLLNSLSRVKQYGATNSQSNAFSWVLLKQPDSFDCVRAYKIQCVNTSQMLVCCRCVVPHVKLAAVICLWLKMM